MQLRPRLQKPASDRDRAERQRTMSASALPGTAGLPSWLGGVGSSDKAVHLMRHGTTEMNVHLGRCSPGYGEPGFTDPILFDTRLTQEGVAGARAAARRVARLSPKPELLVLSPLTRALRTALLAFGEDPPCPVVVEPLFRERLYLSSDVGRRPSELAEEFPALDFDHLPDVWWHSDGSSSGSGSEGGGAAGSSDGGGGGGGGGAGDWPPYLEEPEDVFEERMSEAVKWLAARPERSIAVVCHWGVIYSLTNGISFANCEVRTTRLSKLAR